MDFKKDQILIQLERIVSNKSFSRSKVNVRLLTFLVNATLEKSDVKETTIGTEFFGAKYDPIKSDNKVRVYVYHLRKKLEEYYSTATPDEIVFTIAKGQYLVQFRKYQKIEKASKSLSYKKLSMLIAGAIVLFTSIFFYKKPVNNFWQSLMENEFPTTVIFGDYFTIEGKIPTRDIGAIRDYEINSEKELEVFIKEHPEHKGKLTASRHQYFSWTAPYCTKLISEFWAEHKYPFEMNQVSMWSVSKLGKENIVYFGQTKSMGIFKKILKENFPSYSYNSQVIKRTDPKTQKTSIYKDIITYDDKMTDYTLVAKLTMPTGNEMRFFLSDQDCGAISALEFFTNNEHIKDFYKEHHLKKEDNYIALFKVTGWLRKSYDMEFVLLDKK
ncbi:hypothetical protein [Wenyingzhuangia sp. IMCC45574]